MDFCKDCEEFCKVKKLEIINLNTLIEWFFTFGEFSFYEKTTFGENMLLFEQLGLIVTTESKNSEYLILAKPKGAYFIYNDTNFFCFDAIHANRRNLN